MAPEPVEPDVPVDGGDPEDALPKPEGDAPEGEEGGEAAAV